MGMEENRSLWEFVKEMEEENCRLRLHIEELEQRIEGFELKLEAVEEENDELRSKKSVSPTPWWKFWN